MALVRLKRSLDEEPIDTLIIAYKKRKEDINQTSVFKFATTLLDEKEDVFQHISKVINLVDSKKLYKQKHITNITEKLRKENKLYSQNNRLKLVNCLRESVENKNNDVEDSYNSEVTLLEIESNNIGKENVPKSDIESSTSNAEAMSPEMTKYVYDIYYAPNPLSHIDITTWESEISCHAVDSEMAFECYRDDAYGEDEVEEDEDDSNDENNWRNDYPDEDEDSIDEKDMRFAAMYKGLKLDDDDDDNDLSSDDQDEDLINCVDVSSKDIAMYGEGYAKYKRRIQKEQDLLLSDDDDDDDSDNDYDYNDYISCSDSEKSNP